MTRLIIVSLYSLLIMLSLYAGGGVLCGVAVMTIALCIGVNAAQESADFQ